MEGRPRRGTLIQWNDARGFGFIEDADSGRQVFLHISAYPTAGGRPSGGDLLEFALGRGPDGRPQAADVRVVRSARAARPTAEAAPSTVRRGPIQVLPLVVVPLFLVLIASHVAGPGLPLWGIVIYPAMSAATFLLYLADKRAALAGTWRVRERTLLVAGLLGGWPGGAVAQQVLGHKRRKRSFLIAFWILAGVNVAVFLSLIWLRDPIIDLLVGR